MAGQTPASTKLSCLFSIDAWTNLKVLNTYYVPILPRFCARPIERDSRRDNPPARRKFSSHRNAIPIERQQKEEKDTDARITRAYQRADSDSPPRSCDQSGGGETADRSRARRHGAIWTLTGSECLNFVGLYGLDRKNAAKLVRRAALASPAITAKEGALGVVQREARGEPKHTQTAAAAAP